jgi:tetratricopeptide (TPR) repeat protein
MSGSSFARRVRANAVHWLSVVRAIEDREYRSLDAEWHNLLQAIELGLEREEALPETAELWLALTGFVESRGYFGAWQSITKRVADSLGVLPVALACRIANEAGFILERMRDPVRALALHETALAAAKAAGDAFEEGLGILGLGSARARLRDFDQAEAHVQEALRILDKLDAGRLRYTSGVELLGIIAADLGEYDRAARYFRQSAEGYMAGGHHRKAANSLHLLARAQDLAGDYHEAIETLGEAQTLLKPGIDITVRSDIYTAMGTAYYHLEDYSRAKEAFLSIDQQYLEKNGLLDNLMHVTNNLGNVAFKVKELEPAREYLTYSINLARTLGNRLSLGNTLGVLAEVLLQLGERVAARCAVDEAIEALRDFPENPWARKRLAAILAQREQASG